MPVRTLVAVLVLMTAAAALAPQASATCVTYRGSGLCAETGGQGMGPGITNDGDLCVDSTCPSVGAVAMNCLVRTYGQGIIQNKVCVGLPPL